MPWESVWVNGTENHRTFQLQVTAVTVSVETMNHRLQPGMSCGSTLHVSPTCHMTWLLPWWGSMFRKCVKSHRRHPAIPPSYPCPWMYFESFLLLTTLWLASSLGVLLEGGWRKITWGKLKNKWRIPSPVSVCVGSSALRIVVSLKISGLNCFNGIKVDYSKKRETIFM